MNNFLSSQGRLRRTHYALRILLITGVFALLQFMLIALASADEGDTSMPNWIAVMGFITWLLASACLVLTNARRCHDLNKNGWYQFIPFYGFVLLFVEGTAGTNRYGADPKALTRVSGTTPPPQSPPITKKGTGTVMWDPGDLGKELNEHTNQMQGLIQQQITTTDTGNEQRGPYRKGTLYD